MHKGSAADFMPERTTLPALREAAAGCRGCDLVSERYPDGFGEGRKDARIVMVGEQPGDREDVAGRPFVGLRPAPSSIARSRRQASFATTSTSPTS